jgi:hypothetical protein
MNSGAFSSTKACGRLQPPNNRSGTMKPPRWLLSLPRSLRALVVAPLVVYAFALEIVASWMSRHMSDVSLAHGLKLVAAPGTPNESLYTDKLKDALDLLAEHRLRHLRWLQRHIRAIVVLPGRPSWYSRRGRILMLEQAQVWRWDAATLAVELVGWAVEARFQHAGLGGHRWRERREHRVLLERIEVGGEVLGQAESAAVLRAQAIRAEIGEDEGRCH